MNAAFRAVPVWMVLSVVTAASSGLSWNTALSCLLSITVLTLLIRATATAGWPLVGMVFLMYFGITWVNTNAEAVLFQVLPPRTAFISLAQGATTAFTVAVLLALSLNRMGTVYDRLYTDAVAPMTRAWTWKVVVGACVYFVLYSVAGAIIYPLVREFYAGRRLPALDDLFVIQLFRGLLYIAIALPFLRRMTGRPWHASLVLGLCFSVLGGLAPLLLSNEYMPASIRLVHAVEVGVSNFIYGAILGRLLVTRNTNQDSLPVTVSA